MIDALFFQPSYVAAKKMLDVTELRHEAISSNLANIETPHYQRIDLDPSFMNQLRQAASGQDAQQLASLQPVVTVDTNAVSSRRDGNTVELDAELLNLQQNTLAHGLETQMVSNQLFRLRMAISGHSS